MTTGAFGQPIKRNEDDRLVRGLGTYLDDVEAGGALDAAFLRSSVAHARIARLDVSRARVHPGVVAVYTHADLGDLGRPLPLLIPHPSLTKPRTQRPLARDEVFYVGQTMAMVIAEDRYVAEDALELIEVEYESLPIVVDLERALEDRFSLVHSDVPGNVAAHFLQVVGDPDQAFAQADIKFVERYVLERSAGMPLETRGVVARFDERAGELTVWDSTQAPLSIRGGLARLCGLPEHRVRVIAPDIGGGFGTKVMMFYPEEVLVPWAAIRLNRPIKWIEDRTEHFTGSNHERTQIHDLELAATREGVVLALRDVFLHDTGAFIPYGVAVAHVSALQLPGPYRIPNFRLEFKALYTNTTPVSPYRGCGRPHACFVIERALDRLARELGIDRVEIRRRNFIRPSDFPYRRGDMPFADGAAHVLDSGDYERQLASLLAAVGYDNFPEEQANARKEGRYLGLGLACSVEATAPGPYEGALVQVQAASGKVVVATGLSSQGQSHETTFAQIAAEELGVAAAHVIVETGDTAIFGWGAGTFGSRAAVTGGTAVALAARRVRQKALRMAGEILEIAPEDLDIKDGRVFVREAPDRGITLPELAIVANPLRYAFDEDFQGATQFAPSAPREGPQLRQGEEPGLEATSYFSPPQMTWGSGSHAAVIEVDIETGEVHYLRYFVAHDCGRMINPMVVDGQIMGGIAQGIGGCLYERMAYDRSGQLRNASFMDFLMPYATEVPSITILHHETPSPLNPLGVKGVGEAGVIPVAAVTASAIDDALSSWNVEVKRMPLIPERLLDLISR